MFKHPEKQFLRPLQQKEGNGGDGTSNNGDTTPNPKRHPGEHPHSRDLYVGDVEHPTQPDSRKKRAEKGELEKDRPPKQQSGIGPGELKFNHETWEDFKQRTGHRHPNDPRPPEEDLPADQDNPSDE